MLLECTELSYPESRSLAIKAARRIYGVIPELKERIEAYVGMRGWRRVKPVCDGLQWPLCVCVGGVGTHG